MWAARCLTQTARQVAVGGKRAKSTLATLVHDQNAGNLALLAPRQGIEWSYGDLSNRVGRLAGKLKQMGYGPGGAIASDLTSTAENLLLQLAASHLGAAVLTVKNAEAFDTLSKSVPVHGAVAESAHSFLLSSSFTAPPVCVEPAPGVASLADMYEQRCGRPPPFQADGPLGFYGSASPTTQSAALAAGASAKHKLAMTEKDIILVSVTLNHLFGIGSGVSSALLSGAAIVLPDASGVTGCGSPSQRAEATQNDLAHLNCTLLLADTHTLKALKVAGSPELKSLRGGICKVGSGTDFLEETDEYAGVTLATIGKKKASAHILNI